MLAQDSCRSEFCFTRLFCCVSLALIALSLRNITQAILSFVIPSTRVVLSMGNTKSSYVLFSTPPVSAVLPVEYCHLSYVLEHDRLRFPVLLYIVHCFCCPFFHLIKMYHTQFLQNNEFCGVRVVFVVCTVPDTIKL